MELVRVEAAETRVSTLDRVDSEQVQIEDSLSLPISQEPLSAVDNPFYPAGFDLLIAKIKTALLSSELPSADGNLFYPAGFDRLIDIIKAALQESKVKNSR